MYVCIYYDKTLFAELFSSSKHSYTCNHASTSALCVPIITISSSGFDNNIIIMCVTERARPIYSCQPDDSHRVNY